MKIWKLKEQYNYSVPTEAGDIAYRMMERLYKKHARFNEPISSKWKPFFALQYGRERVADVGTLVHFPVISLKCKDVLFPLLEATVEFLPYETDNGLYYVLNIPTLAPEEVLDLSRSDYKEYHNPEYDFPILDVSQYCFRENAIATTPIFIMRPYETRIFVTNSFMDMYWQYKLKGLDIDETNPLWQTI